MDTHMKHIEFLREYAKCGIHHNYTEPEAKLKVMNEAVAYCSTLQAEVDRLTKEKKELMEALSNMVHAQPNDSTWNYPAAWEHSKQLLTRIK